MKMVYKMKKPPRIKTPKTPTYKPPKMPKMPKEPRIKAVSFPNPKSSRSKRHKASKFEKKLPGYVVKILLFIWGSVFNKVKPQRDPTEERITEFLNRDNTNLYDFDKDK